MNTSHGLLGLAGLLCVCGVTVMACVGDTAERDHGDALGVEAQAVSTPCAVDCDCPIDQVCASGACASNPEFGFGPERPGPICVGTCQCPAGQECLDGACQAGPFAIVPTSGSWYNPARSGWGLAVSSHAYGYSSGDYGDFSYSDIEVTWYTFTPSGVAIWYEGELVQKNGVYTGTLYESQFQSASASVSATNHGKMTLATTSASTGTFSWVLDGVSGSQPVQRFVFNGPGSSPPITGQWFAFTPFPASPIGEIPIYANLFFDVQGSTAGGYVGLYDTTTGLPTWVYGAAATSSTGFTVPLARVTGVNLYPGATGVPSKTQQAEGSLTVGSINAAHSSGTFSLAMPASYRPVVTGTHSLSRQTD